MFCQLNEFRPSRAKYKRKMNMDSVLIATGIRHFRIRTSAMANVSVFTSNLNLYEFEDTEEGDYRYRKY